MKVLVTGGAGFIGSVIVRKLLTEQNASVVNVDCLSYAANLTRLEGIENHLDYTFERADICDDHAMREILRKHRPSTVIHAAAETHVDRSINSSSAFIETNIAGTHNLLEVTRDYLTTLPDAERASFKFIQVSTDEVYGDRSTKAPATETDPYQPSSPYAASKAAADHLVDAWVRTYGFPAIVTHSSNNYGPLQHKEKLIPRMVTRAIAGKSLPIFGSGKQIRDWLYVEDNAQAIIQVLLHGKIGEHYNIASGDEKPNAVVVDMICKLLDQARGDTDNAESYNNLIEHVADRPGHDVKYSMCVDKMKKIGWIPQHTFEQGLDLTVRSYADAVV